MANPLFDILGGHMQSVAPAVNFQQMLKQFEQFKNNFQGNPKAEVMRLMQSGRISQQQLNQIQELASQFQKLVNNL